MGRAQNFRGSGHAPCSAVLATTTSSAAPASDLWASSTSCRSRPRNLTPNLDQFGISIQGVTSQLTTPTPQLRRA